MLKNPYNAVMKDITEKQNKWRKIQLKRLQKEVDGEKIKTKWEINEIENYSKDKNCKINRILNMINKSKINGFKRSNFRNH